MSSNTLEMHNMCERHTSGLLNVSHEVPLEALTLGLIEMIKEVKMKNTRHTPTALTRVSCTGSVYISWRILNDAALDRMELNDESTLQHRSMSIVSLFCEAAILRCCERKDANYPTLHLVEKVGKTVEALRQSNDLDELEAKLLAFKDLSRNMDLEEVY